MRLRTVWDPTINFSLAERLRRTREWVVVKVASRLPRRVRYWSFILEGSRHIREDEVVPEVRYTDLLSRMGRD